MKNYTGNIEKETLENENFRKVLHTTERSQLVVMSLKPGDEIGLETHADHDQFIRIEAGTAEVILDGEKHTLRDDDATIIAAGTEHNVTNVSESVHLKIYTIYTPPEHPEGTVHKDKAEADLYEQEHHA